jgi:Secretion system C-terminal sorting domain/SprB repeat
MPSSKSFTFAISQPSAMIVSNVAIVNASSCPANDGSISIDIMGGTGNYLYKWNTTPAQTSRIASRLSIGQYAVIISDVKGCFTAANATVACKTTGIVSFYDEDTSFVYPNPSAGIVYVTSNDDNNLITIFDLMGKEIYNVRATAHETKIDLQGITNGVYFLRIGNENKFKIMKIVLNK